MVVIQPHDRTSQRTQIPWWFLLGSVWDVLMGVFWVGEETEGSHMVMMVMMVWW